MNNNRLNCSRDRDTIACVFQSNLHNPLLVIDKHHGNWLQQNHSPVEKKKKKPPQKGKEENPFFFTQRNLVFILGWSKIVKGKN